MCVYVNIYACTQNVIFLLHIYTHREEGEEGYLPGISIGDVRMPTW